MQYSQLFYLIKQENYEYALKSNTCCETGCTTYIRDWMFTIIKENLFNQQYPGIVDCQNHARIWYGEYSYFLWSDGITLNIMLPH